MGARYASFDVAVESFLECESISRPDGWRISMTTDECSKNIVDTQPDCHCIDPTLVVGFDNFMKTKAPKASSRYPTPALEKGLDILELFASEPSGLTKSDVARRLGRTISEVFRMLVCLEERGYIAQSPDSDRYHLTLYLFRLAQRHPPIKRMTMQALPIMQQVAHELSPSCHFAVLNGVHAAIISQV